MHVLQVTPYFPPTWAYGGIPRIVDGLSRALVARGVEVTVLTTDALDATRRNGMPPVQDRGGLRILTCPNLSNRLAYHHQLFLPWLPAILGHVPHPDVIHIHGHRHLLEIAAVAEAQRRQIPYVLTANGTLPRFERKQGFKLLLDLAAARRIPRGAARCVAVSAADVRQHREAGVDPARIVLLPNGLDLGEFEPLPPRGTFRRRLGLAEPRPLVVFLGRLAPMKGVRYLVEAFSPPSPAGATLVVAGNDMGEEGPARAAMAPGAPVHFTGLLEGPDRVALLADADVLVYPSADEIFGLVPFEGLLAGTPAVVCDDCGCGELIREAGAGMLVRFGDVAGIRACITALLGDGVQARAMVERGRTWIRSHLGWPGLAASHETLYRSLLPGAAPHEP